MGEEITRSREKLDADRSGRDLPVGPIAMLVTPFGADESVDLDAMLRVAELAARQGATGIALHGLAGEGAKLLDGERSAIIEAVAQIVPQQPIIAGVDHESTYGSTALARAARQAGASAVMAMPAKSSGANRRRIVDYFVAVERAANLPVIIQDAPRASGIQLDVDTLCEIAQALALPSAIKVEDALPSLKMRALHGALGPLRARVKLYGGLGGRYLSGELAEGVDGTVVGPAYIDFFAELFRVYTGDRSRATRLFRNCLPLLVAEYGYRVEIR